MIGLTAQALRVVYDGFVAVDDAEALTGRDAEGHAVNGDEAVEDHPQVMHHETDQGQARIRLRRAAD